MKLRKRITAMLICILMVTGMIMGSTVTTFALKFVNAGNAGAPTTEPAVPGYKVDLQFQKYLYAKNGDTSLLEGITTLDVTIKARYYTPADGGTVQPYHYDSNDNYKVSNWPRVTETIQYDSGDILSSNDEGGTWTVKVPLVWDDNHTYKRIAGTNHGVRIGGIEGHSSYDKGNKPQDYALVPPGVYTFEVWEEVPDSNPNLIAYDPDHYFVDVYVSNILVAGTDEQAIVIGRFADRYNETCVTNVTVWKGQNLGQLSGSNEAASGHASDVADGDTVNNKEYNSDSTNENYTAPGGTWNAEWDSSLSYEDNIENMKNTNALGKVSSTTTVYTDRENYLVVAIPFTNATAKTDLVVSKNVTGNYANLDEVFTYPVTVTDTSATAPTTWDVKYYLTATDTEVVDGPDADNTTAYTDLMTELYGSDQANWITSITNGTETDINLKDGYTFKIKSLSDQAIYTISEEAVTYYDQSYTMTAGHTGEADTRAISATTVDGKTTYTVTEPKSAAGAALTAIAGTTTSKGIYSTGTGENIAYHLGEKPTEDGTQLVAVGTLEDVVITFTNHRDYVTPTGFVMSILPYVGAVVAVLAALVVFIVWKKKRTDQTTGTGL